MNGSLGEYRAAGRPLRERSFVQVIQAIYRDYDSPETEEQGRLLSAALKDIPVRVSLWFA